MNRSTSTIRLGAGLGLLAALLVGLGAGTALGLGGIQGRGGTEALGRAPVSDPVDLTRHSTTLIDGVPGSRGSVNVDCPDGIVIGGGFSHVSSGLRVTASRPDGIHAWTVAWTQTSTDDTALYAYAVCLTTA